MFSTRALTRCAWCRSKIVACMFFETTTVSGSGHQRGQVQLRQKDTRSRSGVRSRNRNSGRNIWARASQRYSEWVWLGGRSCAVQPWEASCLTLERQLQAKGVVCLAAQYSLCVVSDMCGCLLCGCHPHPPPNTHTSSRGACTHAREHTHVRMHAPPRMHQVPT